MPFERPTLNEINERILNDLQSRLGVSLLRRAKGRVYARVMAGVSHQLHGFLEYVMRQMFFDTAEGFYLDRWASIYQLPRKPATKAFGKVKFSYSGEPVEVPIGTTLQNDDGVQFVTTGNVNRERIATVEALIAGRAGNVEAGDEMAMTMPVSGVLSKVECLGIGGGAEEESDDYLRGRLLERVRNVNGGGNQGDFERWAKEVPGVTRAWCSPQEPALGSVTVRIVSDEQENILPSRELCDACKKHLDEKRCVTAIAYVQAPTLKKVSFRITDVTPGDEATQNRIRESLVSLFRREAVPGGVVLVSHIRNAISQAVGEYDHKLMSPTEDVKSAKGELLTVGDITWR